MRTAGIKAQKKQGLLPSFENGQKRAVAYNNAYGLDSFGHPSNQDSYYSDSMPTALNAVPISWQPTVAIPCVDRRVYMPPVP